MLSGRRAALARQQAGASDIFGTVDELPDPGGCCVLLGLGLWPGAQADLTAGLTTVKKKPTEGGESAECLE